MSISNINEHEKHIPDNSAASFRPASELPMSVDTREQQTQSTSTPYTNTGTSKLKLNKKRQDGNPMIKYIRNVPFEWNSEIKCDFECSRNCGLLYLSLKYHKLHAGYIETRLNDLNAYQVKILLALVNVDDPSFLLRDLNMLCYRTQISLVLCYSVEEAAEYIETFRISENKNVNAMLTSIQQRKMAWQEQKNSE